MQNLLFNLSAVQPIHSAKFHGGGAYGEVIFFALADRLASAPSTNCNLFCAYDAKKYLNPSIIDICNKRNIPLLDISEKSPQSIIDENAIDTFYTPLYSLEKKWQIQVKRFVFTWHGVRALEMQYDKIGISFANTLSQKAEALVRYRNIWKKRFYKPKYESLAERIAEGSVEAITVSEHSRASIKGFFPKLADADIPVFYSPMQEALSESELSCIKYKLPDNVQKGKYFLLTSGARWEKNNLRAIMALDNLISDYKQNRKTFSYKIIITGVKNPSIYTRHLRNTEFFNFLNYVDNDELEYLHKNAYAFLFPSLNEGFGYPPIKSMGYGVPTAASGTTSIPEVCGKAALYFDPYSISEIKNRVIQLLDPKIYQEYKVLSVEQYRQVHDRQKADLQKAVDFILRNPHE